ncbi:MAG: aldo/keto reductase [Leptolyngbyaceae cyanobacterium SM1_1_3]|nr:aldo/keto reductase [Leptolyngbyaceae cyanobacterium SM1_1_3]NJN02369.1 aldo/keto reductase [Leptolyngbyaceae cyanobacterium RM1_1_2]NJO10403.1 aldo/keto reductase [Leptolyngbyaceae cyanobacterium SL_1_1]
MRSFRLPSGEQIPALGMGTWKMGESARSRSAEVTALRRGLDLGMTLIDTAEMYGEGGAEEVIAEAIAGERPRVFLVSKVYPHNASRQGVIAACNRSLKRLQTDYLDLYLLHWRSSVPLSETLEAFQALKQAGKIRDYGVSNFDTSAMKAAIALPGGAAIATNQVLYNLSRRGIEWDLLPWCRQQQMPVMAYSPVEQGRLLSERALKAIAQHKDVTAAQVAIAWLLHQQNVVVIPKSSSVQHVEENLAALNIQLSPEDLTALDQAFPAPTRPVALQML